MTSSSLETPVDMMLAERTLGIFLPLEISSDAFTKAYELPIGEHVEKNYKGLSYLSWPFAFRYLKEHFPSVYVAFEEREQGWPVFGQDGCWLLRPYLTDGQKRTTALVFPLMDNKHNALAKLDARAVSDNIQRASVKCIATFTGLGLKLYSGKTSPGATMTRQLRPNARHLRRQRSLLRGQARKQRQLQQMYLLLEQRKLLPPMLPPSSMAKQRFLDSVKLTPLGSLMKEPA